MDARQFDFLARRLRAESTRRRALGGLFAAPFLVQAATEESANAARKRDKGVEADHYHKRKSTYCLNGRTFKALRRKKNKLLERGATFGRCTPCVPDTNATTCEGKCAEVLNNCGTPVDCGVCPCVPNPDNETCEGKCGEVRNNCDRPVNCGVCPPQYEEINGGSFQICNFPLTCQAGCTCSGNIGGNYVCATSLGSSCDFSTDCPVGQACKIVTAGQSGNCWQPCPSG